MATVVTRYHDPDSDGGDGTTPALTGPHAAFATLQAWSDARARNLITLDEIERVVCASIDAAHTESPGVVLWTGVYGWTNNTAHPIIIEAAASDRAGKQWDTSKFRIGNIHQNVQDCISGAVHLIIDGIQMRVDAAQTGGYNTGSFNAYGSQLVRNCHIRGEGTGSGGSSFQAFRTEEGGVITVENSILSNFDGGSAAYIRAGQSTTGVIFRNVTIVDVDYGVVKFFGGGLAEWYNTGYVGMIDKGDLEVEETCSSAEPFFVDRGAGDYTLASWDDIWRGQGTNLSDHFTDDIDGETRPAAGAWDIGADQYNAPTTPATVYIRYIDVDADPDGDGTTSALTSGDGTHAFNSAQAWNDARARNLVALHEAEIVIGLSQAEAHTADGVCTITDDWVTDPTHQIIFKVDALHRQLGVWDETKYRIDVTDEDHALRIGEGARPFWLTVFGVECRTERASGTTIGIRIDATTSKKFDGITLHDVLVRGAISGSAVGQGIAHKNHNLTLKNVIVHGFNTTDSIGLLAENDEEHESLTTAYNCTIADCYIGIENGGTHHADILVENCGLAYNTTNYSPGTSAARTITTSSTSVPLFVNFSGEDFRLSATDTVWRGQATNLLAIFVDDIAGNLRPLGPWAIGASEGVAQTPTIPTITRTAALYDPLVPMHWLFEFDHAGIRHRIADIDLDIGTVHYVGALQMVNAPQQTVDIYKPIASACNCALNLFPLPLGNDLENPDIRYMDLEDYAGVPIIGSPARIWRWAENTTIDDRELILEGHITGANCNDRGVLSLDVQDFSVWYSRKILPQYICEETTWTGADEDDKGKRAPLVFGAFTGVSVPNVDGATNVHLIGWPIKSVSGAIVGGESKTATLANEVVGGVTVAKITIGGETLNKDTTVSGEGVVDLAGGDYSGAGGALLTHAADQLKYLACEIVGIPRTSVDHASFAKFKDKTANWNNTLVLEMDTETNYFEVAAGACLPYRGVIFVERGMLVAKRLDLNDAIDEELAEGRLLASFDGAEWSGWNDVPGGVTVRYDWGWTPARKKWEYRNQRVIRASEYEPFAKAAEAGAQMLRIDAKYVREAATIDALLLGIKELFAKTRRIFTIKGTREVSDLRIFDIVFLKSQHAPNRYGRKAMDVDAMPGKRAAIVGIEYGLNVTTYAALEL